MARRKKNNLEEQLATAKKNLARVEDEVKNYKSKISEIENMIEEREKENAYLLLKEHGLSYSDLQTLLIQSSQSKQCTSNNNKRSKKENVA